MWLSIPWQNGLLDKLRIAMYKTKRKNNKNNWSWKTIIWEINKQNNIIIPYQTKMKPNSRVYWQQNNNKYMRSLKHQNGQEYNSKWSIHRWYPYAWQIGPFWQDTLDMCISSHDLKHTIFLIIGVLVVILGKVNLFVDICFICQQWKGVGNSPWKIMKGPFISYPKVYGANMGPTWGWQDPGGPYVDPRILLSGSIILWRWWRDGIGSNP